MSQQPPRRCRMCDRPADVRPLTRHHIVPQWWFRDQAARARSRGLEPPHWPTKANVYANIVRLCRPCHDLIDHGPRHERLRYRRMLRALLHPEELAFARRTRGQAWLDEEYPSTLYPPELLHPETAVA